MSFHDRRGLSRSHSPSRREGREGLVVCLFALPLAMLLLAGCSGKGAGTAARQSLEIVAPAAPEETVMVEGGCLLADSPSDETIDLRPLEYSEPRFFLADRMPDGMTRDDMYYFDLVGSESGTGARLPCEVNRDTTLPEGFAYLVVDVNVRSHEDEKVEFCLADAMLCTYDSTSGPGLEFPDVPKDEYPRAEFDRVAYGGTGAYSVLRGCDAPFWASGYDPMGPRLPGEPAGNYWRDLWIDPDDRFQFYYIVSEEDARRGDLAWIASARRDVDAPRVYAYRVVVE